MPQVFDFMHYCLVLLVGALLSRPTFYLPATVFSSPTFLSTKALPRSDSQQLVSSDSFLSNLRLASAFTVHSMLQSSSSSYSYSRSSHAAGRQVSQSSLSFRIPAEDILLLEEFQCSCHVLRTATANSLITFKADPCPSYSHNFDYDCWTSVAAPYPASLPGPSPMSLHDDRGNKMLDAFTRNTLQSNSSARLTSIGPTSLTFDYLAHDADAAAPELSSLARPPLDQQLAGHDWAVPVGFAHFACFSPCWTVLALWQLDTAQLAGAEVTKFKLA